MSWPRSACPPRWPMPVLPNLWTPSWCCGWRASTRCWSPSRKARSAASAPMCCKRSPTTACSIAACACVRWCCRISSSTRIRRRRCMQRPGLILQASSQKFSTRSAEALVRKHSRSASHDRPYLAEKPMIQKSPMRIVLAQPRGFCAGVVRAIEIVERALQKYGAPVYVRHEIVHNKHVVDSLKAKGARFVETLSEIPENAVTIFSAHGVARSVEEEAEARGLPVLNATCPLVTKVHNQGKHYVAQGRTLILIGHGGHPEVVGTIGQISGPVVLVQTEEEVEALD